MFTDSAVSFVEFQSGQMETSREKRSKNTQIQTEPFLVREGGIQTVRRKEKEAQTDISTLIKDGEDEQPNFMDMPNDDPVALNAFVRRIGPLVLAELEANDENAATTLLLGNWATGRNQGNQRKIEVDSFGFAIVDEGQQEQQAATDEDCQLIRSIFGPKDDLGSSFSSNVTYLPVSCLTWSPSGATLAVGFGHIDHDSWCQHGATSAVFIWTLESLRQPNKAKYDPVRSLPHSACVTTVVFHPTTSGLLASGTFTGDIVIWDTSVDEAQNPLLVSTAGMALAQPGMNVQHTDFIGAVTWLPFKSSPTVRYLVSACADGLVCSWSIDVIRKNMTQLAGYKFVAGICSLSLNPHDSVTLAAGLANGQLVFWSVPPPGSESIYTLDSRISTPSTPVYTVSGSKISVSSGPIYGCEWSPACPGLCVVATSDGTVLLYSQRDPTLPCMRLESSSGGSLFSVCFSRSRPLLLLAASQFDGAIAFDLSNSSSSASFHLQSSQNSSFTSSSPTLCAEFNPGSGRNSAHLLSAVGRQSGALELWRVSMSGELGEVDSAAALQSLREIAMGTQEKPTAKPKEKPKATKSSTGTEKKKKKKRSENVDF